MSRRFVRANGIVAIATTALFSSCKGEAPIPSSPPPPPTQTSSLTLSTHSIVDTIGLLVGDPLVVQLRRGTAAVVGADVRLSVSGVAGATLVSTGPQNGPFTASTAIQTDASGNASAFVSLGMRAGRGTITIDAPTLDLHDSVQFTVRPGNLAQVSIAPRDTAVFVNGILKVRYDLRDRGGNVVAGTPDVASLSGVTAAGAGTFVAGPEVVRGRIELRTALRTDTIQVSVVPRDTMVFLWTRTGPTYIYSIAAVALDGTIVRVYGTPLGPFVSPEFSPDGRFVIANQGGGMYGTLPFAKMYLYDSTQARIEVAPAAAGAPATLQRIGGHFSKKGDWIFFRTVTKEDSTAVWRVRLDGSELERIVSLNPGDYIYDMYPWTNDTTALVVAKFAPTNTRKGYLLDMTRHALYSVVGAVDGPASVSPRGDMLAWHGIAAPGLWISNLTLTQIKKVDIGGDFVPPAWTRDGAYVVTNDYIVNAATGQAVLLPWKANVAAGWYFSETGARP